MEDALIEAILASRARKAESKRLVQLYDSGPFGVNNEFRELLHVDDVADYLSRCESQREQMRVALEKIESMDGSLGCEMRAIARAALSASEGDR